MLVQEIEPRDYIFVRQDLRLLHFLFQNLTPPLEGV